MFGVSQNADDSDLLPSRVGGDPAVLPIKLPWHVLCVEAFARTVHSFLVFLLVFLCIRPLCQAACLRNRCSNTLW